jgi:hypothetical protein
MADLSSLINPAGAAGVQPRSMLSSLMPNGGQPAPPVSAPQVPPAPTHQQAVAGYHRLQETKRLMGRILQDPRTGRQNIARNNRLASLLSATGKDIPIDTIARLIFPPQTIGQRLKSFNLPSLVQK